MYLNFYNLWKKKFRDSRNLFCKHESEFPISFSHPSTWLNSNKQCHNQKFPSKENALLEDDDSVEWSDEELSYDDDSVEGFQWRFASWLGASMSVAEMTVLLRFLFLCTGSDDRRRGRGLCSRTLYRIIILSLFECLDILLWRLSVGLA